MLQYKYRSYDVDGVRIKPLVLVKTPTRPCRGCGRAFPTERRTDIPRGRKKPRP